MKVKEEGLEGIPHKTVLVIGNGPSGLSLSFMLSGNIPYLISSNHPDEFLSARLRPFVGKSLVELDLKFLAEGLEGRSTNLISLLLDALVHPYADMGLELQPLVEWRPDGKQIDHLVLGKGPPGGAWHSMDPEILTLSLGSWMALPGVPYDSRDGSEKRAYAGNVAKYYEEYVKKTKLENNFKINITVTKVRPLKNTERHESQNQTIKISNLNINDCDPKCNSDQCHWVKKVKEDIPERRKMCISPEQVSSCRKAKACPLSRAFDFIGCVRKKKFKSDQCFLQVPTIDRDSNISNSENQSLKSSEVPSECEWSDTIDRTNLLSITSGNNQVPINNVSDSQSPSFRLLNKSLWLVEMYDNKTQKYLKYTCNNLVLANGASDIPNKLNLSCEKTDPDWFMYSVRRLEVALDNTFQNNGDDLNVDPVLVIGAGLSAADAIIATRGRNIPVLHVFKSKADGLNKQLPENMYPEYHKVHQMMMDGGSSYPLYTALPGYTLTDFDALNKTVELTSSTGKCETVKVSFAAILIGSRPDLNFLPENFNIVVNKNLPLDCKTNPIDINPITHAVNGFEGLYVMGPLVGDNFVRFIPGGALAILADLYNKGDS